MLLITYNLPNGTATLNIALFKEHEDLKLPEQIQVLISNQRYQYFLPNTNLHQVKCDYYTGNTDVYCGSVCTCKFDYKTVSIIDINTEMLQDITNSCEFAETYEQDRIKALEIAKDNELKRKLANKRRYQQRIIDREQRRKQHHERNIRIMYIGTAVLTAIGAIILFNQYT